MDQLLCNAANNVLTTAYVFTLTDKTDPDVSEKNALAYAVSNLLGIASKNELKTSVLMGCLNVADSVKKLIFTSSTTPYLLYKDVEEKCKVLFSLLEVDEIKMVQFDEPPPDYEDPPVYTKI